MLSCFRSIFSKLVIDNRRWYDDVGKGMHLRQLQWKVSTVMTVHFYIDSKDISILSGKKCQC